MLKFRKLHYQSIGEPAEDEMYVRAGGRAGVRGVRECVRVCACVGGV